jgi:hypothetical protein
MRNLHDLDRCRLRIDHPCGNQEGRLIIDAQGQMPAAIVELISNDDCRPPKQRVEGISDLYFTPQIPGIMRSHRIAADSARRRSTV